MVTYKKTGVKLSIIVLSKNRINKYFDNSWQNRLLLIYNKWQIFEFYRKISINISFIYPQTVE